MTPLAEPQTEEVLDAFEKTDRRLRRVVMQLRDANNGDIASEDFQLELKRARRQLRENKEILEAQKS